MQNRREERRQLGKERGNKQIKNIPICSKEGRRVEGLSSGGKEGE